MYLNIGVKDPINKILWDNEHAVLATGGGTITTSELPTGTVWVEKGTPAKLNYTTGAINISKSAKLYADAANNATTYQVEKNHLFVVGDIISSFDVASVKGYAITVIDKTNAAYDVLTVGTTLGVAFTAANGVYLVQIAAQDASGGAGALKYSPNGLICKNTKVEDSTESNILIFGLKILKANLPCYLAPIQVTALKLESTFNFN